MKALAILPEGLEQVGINEVSRVIGIRAEAVQGAVLFDAELKKLCELAYRGQAFSRVVLLLADAQRLDEISLSGLSRWFSPGDTFCVECIHVDSSATSLEIVPAVAAAAKEDMPSLKLDLKQPKHTLFAYVAKDICWSGIDLSGFDLSKRAYRIFTHPAGLKGNEAFAVLSMAGCKPDSRLINLQCNDGSIAIEAALMRSATSPFFYEKKNFSFVSLKAADSKWFEQWDARRTEAQTVFAFDSSMNWVTGTNKNAKIAGVSSIVRASRMEPEFIDVKFDRNSVDIIAARLPGPSKRIHEKIAVRIYDELFSQASNLLTGKGSLVVWISSQELLLASAEKHGFSADSELIYTKGGHKGRIIRFIKARP